CSATGRRQPFRRSLSNLTIFRRLNVKRRLRFAAKTAALILLVTIVGGCGEGSAVPPPASPSIAPVTASAGESAAEDLTFSGALTGRVTAGAPGDAFVCATTAGSFVAGPILGTLEGAQIELNIVLLSFHGAGTYPPQGVSFDVALHHYYAAAGASGQLAIAPDLMSGTLDVALAADTDPNHAVAHVTGAWRCPKGGT